MRKFMLSLLVFIPILAGVASGLSGMYPERWRLGGSYYPASAAPT
jgi:hypothetical protein